MGILKLIKKRYLSYQIYHHNNVFIDSKDKSKIKLKIQGQNNVIKIKKMKEGTGKIRIKISGDNNNIYIDEGLYVSSCLSILIGQIHPNFGKIKNVKVAIGKNTSFESCQITTFNSSADIEIGSECMFSFNVEIYHTDAHPVLDINSREITNYVKKLKIGNHVWVGKNVTILKNTQICDDCIIGFNATVSGKFMEEHCVLAGNPARIVKKNVTWDFNGSKGYIQNGTL